MEAAYQYNAFGKEVQNSPKPLTITLRDEQRRAVDEAKAWFGLQKKGKPFISKPEQKQFLWNAKMRFGKTICALQLAREMNVRRTLIVTHRPVVNENFYEDFQKIFGDIPQHWQYGTKQDRFNKEHKDMGDFYQLEKFSAEEGNHYIFFASLQYLRRSTLVGGDNDDQLKKDILLTDWDLVVVDEAHEGTQTSLGQRVIDEYLKKATTKVLLLTGTPFNLEKKLKETPVFTWDYTQEQNAKREWPKKHPGEPNQYAELPKMNIYTYSLEKLVGKLINGEGDFSFTEFFRTWTGNVKADKAPMPEGMKGKFVHEDAVKQFLKKLCEDSDNSNYPFSKEVYQENFHHTLWIVPGVKEARALEELLHEDDVFGSFDIKNVAGQNNEDEERDDALDKVKKAIGKQPDQTYTITISCGRLTTGVTVPAWTAVLYMKGSEMTSAATYMQTIFRVQSPCTINGRMKTQCYVFDFSPERSLKMIAETSKYATRAKQKGKKKDDENDLTQEERDKKAMADFIELCPVISLDGGEMKALPVDRIFAKLESVYVDRLVLNGFNDNCLYNTEELMKMDSNILNALGEKIAQSSNMEKPKKASKGDWLDLSHLSPEERAKLEEARRKARENRKKGKENPYEGLSEAEIAALEAEKDRKEKERKEREKRISNIRGIALRIPLMMYGGAETGDPNEPITVENFTRKIKDESWAEFMPRGITKRDFNYIRRVFNATRFEEAGKRYRALAREADNMHTEDRIRRIAAIFKCFHNPDKETVLTPWRVVNMHISDTLGGYCFYNEHFDGPNTKEVTNEDGTTETVATAEPRLVLRPSEDDDSITEEVFGNSDAKILEINSKTGLYPLYMTYSLYRHRMKDFYDADLIDEQSVEEEQVVWDDIVTHNIFVICNTPMAARITRRTLCGFRDVTGIHIKDDKIIERAIEDKDSLANDINSVGYWKGNRSKQLMNFTSVVGNPPYQLKKEDTSDPATYHLFMEVAFKLANIVSLITPARFLFDAGKTPHDFNVRMLNDEHLKVVIYEPNSQRVFDNVDIKGGIAITLHNKHVNYGKIIQFTSFPELASILRKVYDREDFKSIDSEIYLQNKFDLEALYKDYPQYKDVIGSNGRERRLTTPIFTQVDVFTKEKKHDNDIEIIGLIDNIREYRFIPAKYIADHKNLLKYKIVLPASNGSGALGEVLSTPLIGEPLIGYTQSFIGIGAFDTKEEASAALKYVKSKFMRTMLGILKVTQHNHTDVWKFVPMQDFTANSDIDWSKDIPNIDKQLYNKYDLDIFERQFIEEKVKPME